MGAPFSVRPGGMGWEPLLCKTWWDGMGWDGSLRLGWSSCGSFIELFNRPSICFSCFPTAHMCINTCYVSGVQASEVRGCLGVQVQLA